MTITELIRQETFASNDALTNLGVELQRAVGERDAADQRVKHCSTEITNQHAAENESRDSLAKIAVKLTNAQKLLDEIEVQRQAAIEELLDLQEQQDAANKSVRAAQNSVFAVTADFTKEQKVRKDAERRVAQLEAEMCERRFGLRQDTLRSLDRHLRLQAARLSAAFDAHESRVDALEAIEEFKRARHANPEISTLCEQRDEVRKFLSSAVVPAVRDMLEESLRRIEDDLRSRFPGGVTAEPLITDEPIEEMLFYSGAEGKAAFLLPVALEDWDAAESDLASPNTSRAMCFVWHFLNELKLKTQDGEFVTMDGRPTFQSHFDLEDVEALENFSVKCHKTVVTRFILSAAPPELQEALTYENENI